MLFGPLVEGSRQSPASFGNSWLRMVLGRGKELFLQISSHCLAVWILSTGRGGGTAMGTRPAKATVESFQSVRVSSRAAFTESGVPWALC